VSARRRLALVGVGSMGANHARVIAESDSADLAVIIDPDAARVAPLAEGLGCAYSPDLEAACRCDAAVIATPTRLHAPQALHLLSLGIPLLVEKPLAPTLDESRAILECAHRQALPLMCGFVERFNPAVTTVLSLLEDEPLHVVGLRHSPVTPRSMLSVVFDLLIHEIDLALRYNRGREVATVCSVTADAGRGSVTEVADCMIRFDSGAIATLSASRAGQRKVRTHLISTAGALYEIDLLRQDVTVYRHLSHEQVSGSATYRAETVVDVPFVRHRGEPLALQLQHFLALLEDGAGIDAERDSILPPHLVAARVESDAPAPVLQSTTA
jgi:predicted dehydrogenase